MRERSRHGLAIMSPHRRAMRRGLVTWVEWAASVIESKSLGQASVSYMAVSKHDLQAALEAWTAMVTARKWREDRVKLCLSRTSPEKRDLILGYESLMARAPAWERSAHFVQLTKSGCAVRHLRDKERDAAVGSPRLRHGDLYTFAFAVAGGGAGVCVGVADDNYLAAESQEQLGGAWGINLSHGALFTKKNFVDWGVLHAQQILPLPSIDRSTDWSLENVIYVEVEVDMRQKPYRIGFGLPDEPMIHAATANIECESVRPWCYLWGENDAVVLLPRRKPKAPRMQPWKHSIRPPLSFRPGDGAGFFRSMGQAAAAAMRFIHGDAESDEAGAPAAPAAAAAAAAAEGEVGLEDQEATGGGKSRAERRSKERRFSVDRVSAESMGGPTEPEKSGKRDQAKRASVESMAGDKGGRANRASVESMAGGKSGRSTRANRASMESSAGQSSVGEVEQGEVADGGVAGGGGSLVPGGPRWSPRWELTTTSPLARRPPDPKVPANYTYYDDPKRKKKEKVDRGHLFDYSVRSFEVEAKKGSVKRMPWDRVRPVTRTYGEFWGQQR